MHIGAAASDSDPFWCDFNPVTGSQYEREVVFNFLCDPEVDGVETLCARQNSPLTATTLFCSRRRRLVPVTAMWRC